MLDQLLIAHSQVEDGNMSFVYGGSDEVQCNRERFLARYNLTLDMCVGPLLSHGVEVVVVDNSHQGRGMYDRESGVPAGALITSEHVTLFMLTADCLTIVIYDPCSKRVALAHVSWRNTKLSFVTSLCSQIGGEPANFEIYIGPCIHKESYDVDLISANIGQLTESGVKRGNIQISPINTFLSPHYFSHRRSKLGIEPERRFATIVKLK